VEVEALCLKALIHESNAMYRAEVMKVKRKHRKMLRGKEDHIHKLEV
jgi:hypothetical protein